MPRLPLTSPSLPADRPPSAVRDPRRRWAVAGSVLLHLLALAALLITRRPEAPMPIAPSYDLIFENGGASTPPTPPEQKADTRSEAPAADLAPTTAPEPSVLSVVPNTLVPEPSPPLPDLEPEPEAEPSPTPEALPEPAAPPQAESVPQPEPEAAPAPSPEPPAVRLAEPEPAPSPLSPQALAPDLAPLAPPPPLPPAPTPPSPRQQAVQPPAPGAFPPPIDLNFGRATSRAPLPRAAGNLRGIDLSLGKPKPGPNKSEAFFDVRAANIGADWMQGLKAYWRRHAYYPPQAGENGEEGTVEVQFVVNRQGKVESVEVKQRSGSPWLDMASVAVWRNAQLPPLPAENTDQTVTVSFKIDYVIVRR